jgi:pimeloyl-ACP methyl ester carboxylesterase
MKADFCETDLRGIRYGSRYGTRVITSSFGDWDLRPGLASLNVPLLVMHGEEETIPMDLVEEWITAMPKGMAMLIKVPRAAHRVPRTARDCVASGREISFGKRQRRRELTPRNAKRSGSIH